MNEQAFNEQEFGLKIRNKLNVGSAGLDKRVADRLYAARQKALAAHVAPTGQLSLAGVGRYFASFDGDHTRPFAAALALIAFLVCGEYITSMQHAADLEEVDSALLADDLPITAYLDRGFDAWLNSSEKQ